LARVFSYPFVLQTETHSKMRVLRATGAGGLTAGQKVLIHA
jgi:hypothetical protein